MEEMLSRVKDTLLVYCFFQIYVNVVELIADWQGALGMENSAISDAQITASSQFCANHAAIQRRLHFQATGGLQGAWSARTNDANQWLQVYLGSESITITKVATQGQNGCCSQWVTKFNLQYSEDKVNFRYYREQGESEKNGKVHLCIATKFHCRLQKLSRRAQAVEVIIRTANHHECLI